MPEPVRDLVVCISLGGTKLQLGALCSDGTFQQTEEILWRKLPVLRNPQPDAKTEAFCGFLADRIQTFLASHHRTLANVARIGLAFPGPQVNGLWQSNNLTPAFRDGVDLTAELGKALASKTEVEVCLPEIRVVFDAQCDAGGEVYHRHGHLYAQPEHQSTVLNLATGIAAGFITGGRVLIGDADFRKNVGDRYDGGAGQLGRHLWYRPGRRRWEYHYIDKGQTPLVPGAVRMTERLSGPALAARLLLQVMPRGLLTANGWPNDLGVPWHEIESLLTLTRQVDVEEDLTPLAMQLRASPSPIASALLRWANRQIHYAGTQQEPIPAWLINYSQTIAHDLASALTVWATQAGWAPFSRHLVLTGGVGIHFLSASDAHPVASGGFFALLKDALPETTRLQRSTLGNAIERECYLFQGPRL